MIINIQLIYATHNQSLYKFIGIVIHFNDTKSFEKNSQNE